jgi:hypothetical protein
LQINTRMQSRTSSSDSCEKRCIHVLSRRTTETVRKKESSGAASVPLHPPPQHFAEETGNIWKVARGTQQQQQLPDGTYSLLQNKRMGEETNDDRTKNNQEEEEEAQSLIVEEQPRSHNTATFCDAETTVEEEEGVILEEAREDGGDDDGDDDFESPSSLPLLFPPHAVPVLALVVVASLLLVGVVLDPEFGRVTLQAGTLVIPNVLYALCLIREQNKNASQPHAGGGGSSRSGTSWDQGSGGAQPPSSRFPALVKLAVINSALFGVVLHMPDMIESGWKIDSVFLTEFLLFGALLFGALLGLAAVPNTILVLPVHYFKTKMRILRQQQDRRNRSNNEQQGQDGDDFVLSPEYTERLNRVFRCMLMVIGAFLVVCTVAIGVQVATMKGFSHVMEARYSATHGPSEECVLCNGLAKEYKALRAAEHKEKLETVTLWTLQFIAMAALAAILYLSLRLVPIQRSTVDNLHVPLLSVGSDQDWDKDTAATVRIRNNHVYTKAAAVQDALLVV